MPYHAGWIEDDKVETLCHVDDGPVVFANKADADEAVVDRYNGITWEVPEEKPIEMWPWITFFIVVMVCITVRAIMGGH